MTLATIRDDMHCRAILDYDALLHPTKWTVTLYSKNLLKTLNTLYYDG